MIRKGLLIVANIILFCSTCLLMAGYESTVEEEAKERRVGEEHDADITSRQEEISRTRNVDDAYITENQERIENLANVNEAYTTSSQELSENLGENARQR